MFGGAKRFPDNKKIPSLCGSPGPASYSLAYNWPGKIGKKSV